MCLSDPHPDMSVLSSLTPPHFPAWEAQQYPYSHCSHLVEHPENQQQHQQSSKTAYQVEMEHIFFVDDVNFHDDLVVGREVCMEEAFHPSPLPGVPAFPIWTIPDPVSDPGCHSFWSEKATCSPELLKQLFSAQISRPAFQLCRNLPESGTSLPSFLTLGPL